MKMKYSQQKTGILNSKGYEKLFRISSSGISMIEKFATFYRFKHFYAYFTTTDPL